MRRDHRAFSLIELLIVVAIILIIAAIAIPNLLRSRIAANQASAVQSLRVIHAAEVTYFSQYGIGFVATLTQLGPPAPGNPPSSTAAGMLDSILVGGIKSGYSFIYAPTNPDTNGYFNGYTINANPTTPGTSGTAYYFTDHSFVIRVNATGPASVSDTPIAQ